MLDPLQFVQLRPLDRRERPRPLSVEQRLQALLCFRGAARTP
jgi:hypothetical protein